MPCQLPALQCSHVLNCPGRYAACRQWHQHSDQHPVPKKPVTHTWSTVQLQYLRCQHNKSSMGPLKIFRPTALQSVNLALCIDPLGTPVPLIGWQKGHAASKNPYHSSLTVFSRTSEERKWRGIANPGLSGKQLLHYSRISLTSPYKKFKLTYSLTFTIIMFLYSLFVCSIFCLKCLPFPQLLYTS